jgi:hypothetical protein
VDEVFYDPPTGVFHFRASRDDAVHRGPVDGQATRSFEAVAPVDGVYTLQFASGLPDAATRPDSGRVWVYPDRSKPIVDDPGVSPPLALLVGRGDARSVSRIALAVRAREAVTIRAETPSDVPQTDAEGTQQIHVKLFLSAKDASTSADRSVTRRTKSDVAGTRWSFLGAELAHGPQAFSRVGDGRPVTLWSCAVNDRESGLERTAESLVLRLQFVPQPVASDHAADGD